MNHRIVVAALLASLVTVVAPASAQEKVPKRPKLDAALDTNDAQSYLELAYARIEKDPEIAAAAYYWASRLNPGSAAAFYGRAVAGVMADPGLLKIYIGGSRSAGDRADLRRIDSLEMQAQLLDPFLHRNLDRKAFTMWAERKVGGNDARSSYYINQYFSDAPPSWQAWFSYNESRFPDALNYYADAIRRAREKAYLYGMRGETFYLIGNTDSALANLKLAVKEQKRVEDKKLVVFYQPKARYEHQVGWIYEHEGKLDEAREAYGRALTEDLSFYPAHARLGLLALARNDTATALLELDLATQTGQRDAPLRYQYGFLLAVTGKLGEASQQVLKAIEIEPFYAEPYAYLARLYEASGMADLAVPQYTAFLQRASVGDPQRSFVTQRLEALKSATVTKSPDEQ